MLKLNFKSSLRHRIEQNNLPRMFIMRVVCADKTLD